MHQRESRNKDLLSINKTKQHTHTKRKRFTEGTDLERGDLCKHNFLEYMITELVLINQSKFTLNLKTATTSGGLQRRTKIKP